MVFCQYYVSSLFYLKSGILRPSGKCPPVTHTNKSQLKIRWGRNKSGTVLMMELNKKLFYECKTLYVKWHRYIINYINVEISIVHTLEISIVHTLELSDCVFVPFP